MNKKVYWPVYILIITVIVLTVLHLSRIREVSQPETSYHLPTEELERGFQLSQAYCTRCHTYPEPGLLPNDTWQKETLPAMGAMLGIYTHNGNRYPMQNTPGLPDDYYPDEPLLNSNEWQLILDFYDHASPDQLPAPVYEPEITTDSLFFKARTPDYPSDTAPVITNGVLDPANQLIYISDANTNTFRVFDSTLTLINEFATPSPISYIELLNDTNQPGERDFLITYIGHLNPSDSPLGSMVRGWYNPQSNTADIETDMLTDSLIRPVEGRLADFDGDHSDDLLIAEFGHTTGKLSWIKNEENEFKNDKNILIDIPGCIQSHLLDYTNNGLTDVVALCAQLEQSIFLFENRGSGRFERRKLKQFRITAGSSSFELYDFNQDGHLDILYTSGDNADFSIIFKPYHGVYLFLNDGNNNFEEEWFYPVNGAYRAIARDFDNDGHTDIAAIAYFADYANRPEEGFVFFKNEGGLDFTPYHHPAASAGRWIRMDVADWTGNGYDDILLSNFSIGPAISNSPFSINWSEGPPFLLLQNQSGSTVRP